MPEASRDVQVELKVVGLDQQLYVMQFWGQEGISQLFQFQLVLAAETPSLDLESVVGQPGVLTLSSVVGKRHVNGIVSRFQVREKGRNFTIYQATLVPAVWRLQHRRDLRIFQDKSIQQIIEAILRPLQIDHRFRSKGNAAPKARDYCVQYRESDWGFICRLLEEEGYYFFFEHSADKHVLQMGNDYHLHPEIAADPEGLTSVRFHEPGTTTPAAEHIFSLYYEQNIRPGKVTLNDYNFEKPAVPFLKDKEAQTNTDLELYDYPGRYEDSDLGKELCGIRVQEQQANRTQGEGKSDCTRFTAGYCFTLTDYYRQALCEQKYLLTAVVHEGTKHQDLESGTVSKRIRYSNSFRMIPREVPFRPPRLTRKPTVQGCQTAVVTGPSGQEVHTDKYGRVKVQFHWDREGKHDEKSSCWIRVGQVWAGQGWGAMFIPRIGQEVIVDFLEGDPDRPIIVGCVYHAQNPAPLDLPSEKTRSTIKSNSTLGGGGFNEIQLEDKKGAERVYVHGQKDLLVQVKNDITSTADANVTTRAGKNQSETIGKKLSITAGEEVVLTCGAASFTLKKDGTITLSGATIQITGSGEVSVQGMPIKLN